METNETIYIVRHFLLQSRLSSSDCSTRIIRQFHFTSWPDFDCPQDPQHLIRFIEAVRLESGILAGDDPIFILVHCSAGVGRTGTFIALDIMMEQVANGEAVDVFNTVLSIRKARAHMVQSEEQYHFLYKCVAQYIQNQTSANAISSASKM